MVARQFISIDGVIKKLEEASLPVSDRGVMFGHAIFETVLIRENRAVLWEEHMLRLKNGCDFARLPWTPELPTQLHKWLGELLKSAQSEFPSEAWRVRMQVTGGDSPTLDVPRDSEGQLTAKLRVIMYLSPIDLKHTPKALKLMSFSDARSRQLVGIKTSYYLWNMIALDAAKQKGFDDALLVSEENTFTESTTANFIWLNSKQEVIVTPKKGNSLPGTTELALVRALEKQGWKVRERLLHYEELEKVCTAFVASSVRGLCLVESIDNIAFTYPKQLEIQKKFQEALREEQMKNTVDLFEEENKTK